jgi:ribosome-binding factor A
LRKNSIKNTRLNEEVMRELSTIIRNEIKDPRIHPLTTVSAVQVAPDLKTCKVYISVLGDKKEKEDTIAGLKNAAGYARRCLAQSLNLRNTPELRFILDESIEYGIEMSKKIDALTGGKEEE